MMNSAGTASLLAVTALAMIITASSLSHDATLDVAYAAGAGSATSDILLINDNYYQMDVRTNPAILSAGDEHVMMYISLTNVDTVPDPTMISGVEYSLQFVDGQDLGLVLATVDAYAPGEELAIMITPFEGEARTSGEIHGDGFLIGSETSPIVLEAPIFLGGGLIHIYATVNSIDSNPVSGNDDDNTFDLMFSMGEFIPFAVDIDGAPTDLVFATYFDRIDKFAYDAQTRTVSAHMPFTWTDKYIESASFIHAEYYIPRTVDLFENNEILLAINGMDYFGTIVRSGSDDIEIHYLLSTDKLKEMMKTLDPEYAGKMVFEMRAGHPLQAQVNPGASLEAGDTVIIGATDGEGIDAIMYELHLSAEPSGMIHPETDLTFLLDIIESNSGKSVAGATFDLEVTLDDNTVLSENGKVSSGDGESVSVMFDGMGYATLTVSNIENSNAGGTFSFVVGERHDMSGHGGHDMNGHGSTHSDHDDDMHKEHGDLLSAHSQMIKEHQGMMKMMSEDESMMSKHDAMIQEHDIMMQSHNAMMQEHHEMMLNMMDHDDPDSGEKMAEFDAAMQEHNEMMQEHRQMMDTHNEMLLKQEEKDDPSPAGEVADDDSNNDGGGGCLIATAAFGSELAPQVQQLRELRDNTVLATESGTAFMSGFNQIYYAFSPTVADLERENPALRDTVRVALTPMLSSLALLSHANIDTEAEMFGYGISIILLNAALYVGAPVAIAVYCIRLARGRLYSVIK